MADSEEKKWTRHLYWLPENEFQKAKLTLPESGFTLSAAPMSPCEVLRAKGNKASYASPGVWSRACSRQGSWYRGSHRQGEWMIVSDEKLPAPFDPFLDAILTESDFVPTTLPSDEELERLTQEPAYQEGKPAAWEEKGIKDAVMFKTLFTLTRFWGWGENLSRYWTSHKANHANFLSKTFTTLLDGEKVPYTVAENAGVCSSCVEYFNVISADDRKLVRACPGAVTFGQVKRDIYYDVKPVRREGAA